MNPGETATILLVDDDGNLGCLMEWAIRKSGINAVLQCVPDGDMAFHYLSGLGKYGDRGRFPMPSLLLLDVRMPRLNGFEVLEWVKRRSGLESIPVIIWSSWDLVEDEERAFALGAAGYAVKPVDPNELVNVVADMERFWTDVSPVSMSARAVEATCAINHAQVVPERGNGFEAKARRL